MSEQWRTANFEAHEISAKSSPPEGLQPCLMEISGDKPGRLFPLTQSRHLIGCADECHLQIEMPGVSRRHCQAVRTDDGYRVDDLGSTNGTFVNGCRIDQHPLREGDRIALGPQAILLYRVYSRDETSMLSQLYDSVSKDPHTGAFNRKHLLEWLQTQLALSQERNFDVALFCLGLDTLEILPGGDDSTCDGLAQRAYRHLADSKKESCCLSRLGPLIFVLAQPYVRETELQKTWDKIYSGLRAISPFRTGLTATRDLASPTPEKLLEQALRNLELAQLSGSEEAVR